MGVRRSDLAELMDDPTVPFEDLERALGELATINRWLGGYRTTRAGIGRLTQDIPFDATITVLDIGSGGNDLTAILRPLNKRFEVTALDINPRMHEYAVRHGHQCRIVTASAHSLTYADRSFDIVHVSLFLHHCTDVEAVQLLRHAARIARIGVVVNDLHRHPCAIAGISALTALFARSPIVKYDARASVRRAFTRKDLDNLLGRAGIPDAKISWCWAFRWCIWFRIAEGRSNVRVV